MLHVYISKNVLQEKISNKFIKEKNNLHKIIHYFLFYSIFFINTILEILKF